MKRFLLVFGVCVLLGCRTTEAESDCADEVAVDLAVSTMADAAPKPPQPYDCPRCKDAGWITHGDGHRTPCPDCSDGDSGPRGGPLDTWHDAKELIRKGNDLADRSEALFDQAEHDGKITVDIQLPKPDASTTRTCPGDVCPIPAQPREPVVRQPAATSHRKTYTSRRRLFRRWRR